MAKPALSIPTHAMSTEEWLKARRRGIGGSDAAAVVGLNPWRSKVEVWLEKTGQIPLDAQKESERMFWGTRLEEIIAQVFAERMRQNFPGLKVRRDNRIRIHPKYPFMLCNVDRLIYHPLRKPSRGILEVKNTSEYQKSEWADGNVPDMYYIQMQHNLAVTGMSYGYFAVLIGGRQMQHYLVERDEELISHLIRAEAEFWAYVEGGVPPEIDGTEASTQLLNRMYPDAEAGKVIQLPEDAKELFQKRAKYEAQIKVLEEHKSEVDNQIKMLLGEAEQGFCGGWKVTWKNVNQTRLDSRAIKENAPDVFDKYAKQVRYRRFLVSGGDET